MDIEAVFDYLPSTLLDDLYFKQIMDIIIRDFRKLKASLVYNVASSLDIPGCQESSALLQFVYHYDDNICSLGIKKEDDDSYCVFFEVESSFMHSNTVLVKNQSCSSVREVSYKLCLGFMSDYELSCSFYDSDYNQLHDIDLETIKDKLFSKDFGIPSFWARFMRSNFNNYSEKLSMSFTERRMKERDSDLAEKDIFYFTSPFVVAEMKRYFIDKSNSENRNIIRDILNISSPDVELPCLNRLDRIISQLNDILGLESLIVMSDNLYQNIKRVISGLEADAFDTRGIIIKKDGKTFEIYSVHIMSDKIDFDVKTLSSTEVEIVMQMNNNNLLVPELKEFFESSRNL